MADEIVQLDKCLECGSDIRENTQFCYNCGKSLVIETVPDPVVEATANEESVNDEIGQPPVSEGAEKRATAALERKRSRQGQRRPTKFVWVEPGQTANLVYILVCLIVFILAAVLVFLTTILK